MPNIKGWQMYDPMTDREVTPDSVRTDHKGQEWTLHGVARAPEGASAGRILASREGRRDGLYPAVFDLEIRPAGPEPEGVEELFASLSEDLEGVTVRTFQGMAVEAIHKAATACGDGCRHDPAQVIAVAALTGIEQALAPILLMAAQAGIAYGRTYPEERPGE